MQGVVEGNARDALGLEVLQFGAGGVVARHRNALEAALAIGNGGQRLPGLPELPTAAEQVVAGYDAHSWAGLKAPVGPPHAIVNKLNVETLMALKLPQVKARLEEIGGEARGSTPEEMKTVVASELQRWTQVVTDAKIPKQ